MNERVAPDDEDGEDWDDEAHGGVWHAGADDHADDEGHLAVADDADRAAAVRTVRLVVVALVLATLGVLAMWLSGSLEGDDEVAGTEDPTVLGGGAEGVGPPVSTAIESYVAERRAALAAVDGTRVAVVSLVSYRPDAAVEELLESAGAEEADVLARLVALPGGPSTAIDVAVADWLGESRSALQAERDEIAGLLPTIEDPNDPFIASYLEDIARLDAQLAALDPAGELVFAVVVRADAGALRRLADRPEVRLVDAAPDAELGPLSSYRGLRPDELDVAGTPATRPD